MNQHPANAVFRALNNITSRFDQFLIDAGITRQQWNDLDNEGRRSYWMLFGPEKKPNCMGEQDYDGDLGREFRDNQDDNRR